MTEHSIAGAIPNPSIVLPTGKAALPIKAGQANAFKAKSGEHYGNLKKKDAEEQLLDNVVAKPAGEDAKPVDAEGAGLTLESAFIQAPVEGNEGGNQAAMPGQLAQGYQPSAQGAAGAALHEGINLGGQVFAYAGADALLLAQADTGIKPDVVASGAATPAVAAAGIGPLGVLGIVGLGVGVAAGAGGSSAPATVAQSVDTTAPVFSSGATANFAENGTGTAYDAAADSDSGVTYTKSGTDASLFSINASTGLVTFATSPNYEAPADDGANNVYNLNVIATDAAGNATTQAVAITVNDVNEAPVMASGLMTTSVFEVSDAAAATSTAYTLLAGQTAQGTLTGTGDEDWYKVYLTAGQQYKFAMTGAGASNVQDTLMGLYNSSGVLLTYNDDGLEGKNSAFSYTPNASGYYYIDATAYYPSDSGAYELTFTSGSSPSFDAAMGAGVIDSDLFWGAAGSPVAITYGFRQSWSSAYSSTSNLGTFSQLTAAEISGVRSALQFWSDICGITFTEVNPGGYTNSATMLIGNYSDGTDGAGAFAYYPNTANTSFASSDGDLWLNLAGGISSSSLPIGSFSFFAILHEIGHAIGLSHPGLYNAAPGVSITYADNAQFVQDSNQYSVMSYFGGTSTGAFSQLSGTPMMFDILAAQNIYGVNMATRATDTIYGFNSTADSAYLFSGSTASSAFCIWDGAGTDTIDVSGFAQNQLVNLGAGTFSDVGSLTANLSIAIGCSIENAKGGSGSDVIVGNDLNNAITGGAGNDMLFGGAGSDTAIFSSARSNYVISSMTDSWSVVGTDGTDQLFNFEFAQFSDQTITLASNSSYVITSYIKASFAENATGTVYAATATDVDAGATLSYSLGGADASLFNISSAGAVTFKAVPNYEAPADAGANNVYNVTVTASDFVNVSDAQAVAITVTDVVESLAGQSVIDLGSYGKLIAPVQVEGAWYYYWDRSGDGTSTDTGSLNGGVDYTTHNVLDGIFTSTLSEVNAGTTGTGTDTTDLIRYATLNGVKVALPTANGGEAYPQGINAFQSGTSYSDAGASTNGTTGTFNELLAIWDAYNGTGTGIFVDGTPSGWQAVDYWSATPSASGHAGVYLDGGLVYYAGDGYGTFVALQVL